MKVEKCPLCDENASLFCEKKLHFFYKCQNCEGIFRPKHTHLTSNFEKSHYEKHQNDVNDLGYQNFVFPVVQYVLDNFSNEKKGLDFGSGTAPVISKLLNDNGFKVQNYDLYFENKPELLEQKYDFITCCEVMEHFKEPMKEFQQLQKMLIPKGKLICKTELFRNTIPFENWYYKEDLTHIFIFQEATIHWIQKNLPFKKVEIFDKIIIFEN